MKAHRSIQIGAVGEYNITVVERREASVSETRGGIWVNATLECAAIVITHGTKTFACDIHGKELPPEHIPG
jgi:hypothetical protein